MLFKDELDMDARPNHTVYINNLNEKVKKEGESFPSIRIQKPMTKGNLWGYHVNEAAMA